MTPPLAHAGHWINALLYLLPVVLIAALLVVQSRRDRRRDEEPPPEGDGPDPPAQEDADG